MQSFTSCQCLFASATHKILHLSLSQIMMKKATPFSFWWDSKMGKNNGEKDVKIKR